MHPFIRPATSADYPRLAAIASEAHALHSAAHPEIFQAAAETMPHHDVDSILASDQAAILVIEADDQVAGYGVITLRTAPAIPALVPRTFAYLTEFAIARDFWRQGLGRMLFAACLEWAGVRGATSLDLTLWEFNQQAAQFYEALGMATIQRRMSIAL